MTTLALKDVITKDTIAAFDVYLAFYANESLSERHPLCREDVLTNDEGQYLFMNIKMSKYVKNKDISKLVLLNHK